MEISKKRFELHYVVQAEVKGSFEVCMNKMKDIKSKLLEEDLYTTNPVIYRVTDKDPSNATMQLVFHLNKGYEPEEGSELIYKDKLVYEECLYTRYFAGQYTQIQVESELKSAAEKNNLKLQEPYYVNIPIPGGRVVDVYAPID